MKYLVNIDMSGNEIQNVVLQPLATEPSGPTVGRLYYDTADHRIKTYNGSRWVGVAELDANGKVPASQLPDYVDDVHLGYFNNDHTTFTEFFNAPEDGVTNPARTLTPTWGHLYIDYLSHDGWIWDGSAYVLVSSNLELGEASNNAYRGDRGKIAYNHSQTRTGNPHNVTKSDVGLGDVDNKSEDTIKSDFTGSIAYANTGFVIGADVYDALALKIDASLKGAASGVAELDANGKVPASQLPSYVDDVTEGRLISSTRFDKQIYSEDSQEWIGLGQVTPETGKIYVDRNTGKTYRWSGTAFVEISASLALGETSSTAYRGDRGKTAYDHSQLTSGNPHNVSKSDVGLGNVDNTSDATKKTNFTGSIASGDTGFVTGDAVYDAIAGMTEILSMTDDQYTVGSAGSSVLYTFTATVSKKASEIAALVDKGVKVYVSSGDVLVSGNVYSSLIPLVSIVRNNNTVVGATFDGTISPNSRLKFTVNDSDSNNVQGKIISANHVDIFKNKGTIGTSSTSVTVNYSGVFIGAYADISGEMVMTSVSIGAGSVTFTVAAAPSAAITCTVVSFVE